MDSEEDDSWDIALENAFKATDNGKSSIVQTISHTCLSAPCGSNLISLPDECIFRIYFQFFSANTICCLALVCRKLNELSHSDRVWRHLFEFRYGKLKDAHPQEHPFCLESCADQFAGDNRRLFQHWHGVENNWKRGVCSVQILEGHCGGVTGCELRAMTLVTAGQDSTIRWWDLRSSEINCVWTEQAAHGGEPVWGLCVRGEHMATSGGDSFVKLWSCAGPLSVEGGSNGHGPVRCVGTLRGHAVGEVWCVDMDEALVFSGGRDAAIRVWDRTTGSGLVVLAGHQQPIFACRAAATNSLDGDGATDSAGGMVLSGSGDGVATLWDVRTGRAAQV